MAWWITFHTFKGPLSLGNYSPPTRFNCLFEQGVGGLKGHIGLPALQPVPCLSGSAWVEGAWAPCISNILGL